MTGFSRVESSKFDSVSCVILLANKTIPILVSGKIGPVQYIIDLASMEYDQECDAFYSLCRCGGRFEISVSDLDTDASIDAVECSQCSLFATISTKAEL
ncbi:DnaJ subfamily C member 24, variant 2 [Batrachochytrium dendrobatidis]|nr:DnaJ subfamily C member 24, variant 2 [Batrachochytrium dendrobatidis]